MDEKTLHTLEYPKILERLAGYAAFSASVQMARNLRPTHRLEEARRLQQITSEARLLLSLNSEISVGGVSDIRPLVERAARHGVLEPAEFLAIKDTLISARNIARSLERKESTFPLLVEITAPLTPPPGLIETISRVISDRGEILDSASETLARLRREVKVAFDRLMTRLEHMVNDPKIAPMLQDNLITQRNGRYVIPLRAEFKGQVRSIIHDQSSSGATLFVEPLAVVDLNNEWHELQLRVRDEERRILAELSDQVGAHFETLSALTEALARFDFALACAKYAEDLRASEPVLVPYRHPARPDHPGSTIRLIQARHPLLDPQTVVPIDVELDEETFCVVITGPNTGGKTVTLKTVGLLALMAQSGLHIPARSGSALSVFDNIFADIGDEQSIEQSLSTFSGHIKNISRILRRAHTRTLVLFDELGAGTDPQEGAALARAILGYMVEKRIPCLIATHYPELKIFAHNTPGVINASMEFDLNTLRPTYHLTLGLPGRSNALAIASRLGLDPVIIEKARAEISPEELRAENLLNEIHRQRDAARRARERAEKEQREVERLRAELAERLEKIEEERQRLLEKVREEAEQEAEALRREVEEVRRQLMRARQPLEALQPLREKSEALVENARTVLVSASPLGEATSTPQHPFHAGDKVRVRSLGMQGVITALGEEDAEVQVGNLRVRARLSDLQKPGQKDSAEAETGAKRPTRGRTTLKTATPSEVSVYYPSPGMEIDLRGQIAEDALDALERYLESAVLAGLPFVRIIHGKGTGKLRQVIRQALDASPHVKSHSPGEEREGGEGVTIARLKVD